MIVSRSVLKQLRLKGNENAQKVEKLNNKRQRKMQFQHLQTNRYGDKQKITKRIENQHQLQELQGQNQQKQTFQTNSQQGPIILSDLDIRNCQLNLSHKQIKQLKFNTDNEFSLRQVRYMNLSNNQIRQILPTVLVPFQFLQFLDLSNNKLQKISFPYNKMGLRQFKVSQNKLSNLNLQHLKCLESVDASFNKLIFITLPQSIKSVNLDHNMLANTYFVQKCNKIQYLSINYNFIYDLNFNSINELDGMKKTNDQKERFPFLKKIQCGNNKISQLNGFHNLKSLETLLIENNQLSLTRQNMNQLVLLQKIQNLNTLGNPQEGLYSQKELQNILFNKLPNLKSFNSKSRGFISSSSKKYDQEREIQKDFYQEQHEQSQDNFNLYQSSYKKQIIEQSNRKQNQLSMQFSGEKPFRLFLDDQVSQKHQTLPKPQQKTHERIYTLGDVDDWNQDSQVEIQRQKQRNYENPLKIIKIQNPSSAKKDQQSNKKINQLKKEFSKKSLKIIVPLQQAKKTPQTQSFQINSQTKTLLKMIYELSFIPPQPLKYSSNSLLISKRLDQDEDEYYLFSKLFEKRKGILYLKKIFLLQAGDFEFQSEMNGDDKLYELAFFNAPNLEEVYKNIMKKDCLLIDVIDTKMMANLGNYLSPIPGAFGCYHIAFRYLIKKSSAFDQRNLTPVCYLIESKII